MFKKIAIAAALAVVASSSFAAGKPSFYAGGDVGSTKIDGISDRQTSFGAYLGYEFAPNFAVEVGARRLADFDYADANVTAKETVNQYAFSVVGTLPLSNGFNVFGRLGFNTLKDSYSENGRNYSFTDDSTKTGALYGVGVGYAFTPTISARAELQRPDSNGTNVSVGVSFKF